MFEKLEEILESVPSTIVSGVCIILSFVSGKAGWKLPFDPAWVSVALSGIPLVVLAIKRIFVNKGIAKISSALLISMAMVASIVIGDLFAAGEVAFIMAIGELLEDFTTDRARKGLKKLVSIVPVKGTRIEDGEEHEVEASDIRVGDILRIRPGQSFPADGRIVAGETTIDQSVLTGESIPVDRTVGDDVFCGTVNCFGSVDIVVTKAGEDSSLRQLIRLVEEAEEHKAPMQRIADKYASIFVPVALLIAIAAYVFTGEIIRAVTVMVVFCPCALVLATPTAIMAAIGQATKHGVVVKSGEALEKMGKVRSIAFDKTGTLTFGKPHVSDIVVLDAALNDDGFLSAVASCEARSEHPLAKAIVAEAGRRGIPCADADSFSMSVGKGITAVLGGREYRIGGERMVREMGLDVPECAATIASQGKAVVLAVSNGKVIGVVGLSDEIRPDAPTMVEKLVKLGARPVLLTGDNEQAASYMAAKAGIEDVRSGLLPSDKLDCIEALRRDGLVCMIGDGVNDAPALKAADVGIAMGKAGSDMAVEAADIALVGDDISKIPYLTRLSRGTLRTIRFGISLSMTINVAAVTLSVLGLLNPTTGALVHNAGSCLVVAIAALLYDRKFD